MILGAVRSTESEYTAVEGIVMVIEGMVMVVKAMVVKDMVVEAMVVKVMVMPTGELNTENKHR